MEAFFIALSPAIAAVWLLYAMNTYRPESKLLVAALFVAGGASTMLALVMNHMVEKYTVFWPGAELASERLGFWILGVGLNEEFAKMLVLLVLLYPRRDFQVPYQGLLGAATVALGFAAVENMLYLERFGTPTLLLRSGLTVPAHAFFSIPMGVCVAYSRVATTAWRKYWWLLAGLSVAVLFHGGYDVWLSLNIGWWNNLAYVQVVAMGLVAWRLTRLRPAAPAAAGALGG